MDSKSVNLQVDNNKRNNGSDASNDNVDNTVDKNTEMLKPQISGVKRMKSGDARKKREGGSHMIPAPSPSSNNNNNNNNNNNKSKSNNDFQVLDMDVILGGKAESSQANYRTPEEFLQHQQHRMIHRHSETPALRSLLRQVEKSLYSTKTDDQLAATKKIRQLLSVEREYLIDDVIAHDLIPRLLSFLKRDDVTELQVEALWALTNVAAGSSDHARVLIQKGAIPALVGLMGSSNDEVLEQAVWVLGNLAGDGPPARDKVLKEKALVPLLQIINNSNRLSLQRISTWALSNICDGQPQAYSSSTSSFNLQAVLSCLVKIISNDDTEVLSHVCWALSHLCDGPSKYVEQVVHSNVCQRLIALLEHRSWRVAKPALRTIGNIVCAEDEKQDYTQHIVQLNAVHRLEKLVSHSNREIQKEACWTLSNIAAGSEDQIQYVLNSGVIPLLIKLISDDRTDQDVKIEACWVILNATSCGSGKQIEALSKCGCVTILCNLLGERSMAGMALEGLEKVLKVGELVDNGDGNGNPILAAIRKKAILDGGDNTNKKKNNNNKKNQSNNNSSKTINDNNKNKKKKSKGSDTRQANFVSSKNNGNDSNNNGNPESDSNIVFEKPNRHAHLIDLKKVEMLQKSGDPVLSKRASSLWNNYFITCAICNNISGKNARDCFYCNECKCMVCTNCSCEKFHLSYQLSQWDEMYAEEAAEKSSKAKAKKKKRKKKKQREKEKKKATSIESIDDRGSNINGSNNKNKNNNNTGKTAVTVKSKKKSNNVSKPEIDDDQEEIKVGINAIDISSSSSSSSARQQNKNHSSSNNINNNNGNDDYVDYLSQGGSIFELAKMLDDDIGAHEE